MEPPVITNWNGMLPISVEEQNHLLVEGWCDDEGYCWGWRTDGIEEFWEYIILPADIEDYNNSSLWKYTHTLPHYAITRP